MTNSEIKKKSFIEATKRRENKVAAKLLEIAKAHSYAVESRGDLERRNNDSEDFLDIPVWALQAMLKEAYELGKRGNL